MSGGPSGSGHSDHETKTNGAAPEAKNKQSEEISDLKGEIEAMRKQLQELARDRK